MLNHDDQLQISTPLPVALENLRNFFPASLRDFFRSHMNMTTIVRAWRIFIICAINSLSTALVVVLLLFLIGCIHNHLEL